MNFKYPQTCLFKYVLDTLWTLFFLTKWHNLGLIIISFNIFTGKNTFFAADASLFGFIRIGLETLKCPEFKFCEKSTLRNKIVLLNCLGLISKHFRIQINQVMMFCFRSILQIWIIFIGFRDMNDFVNLGICKHDSKFTCRGAAEAIADLP